LKRDTIIPLPNMQHITNYGPRNLIANIYEIAHHIRDRNTTTAKSVFALQGTRRWAMTGTPIQNRLTDLVALFQFLRLHPYSDPKVFDADIVQLWKHESAAAIERLKKLIACIAIRRSSSTIDLPERTDQVHYLDFSPAERDRYEEVRAPTVELLDQAIESGTWQSSLYLHALQGINALRIICNLGVTARVPLLPGSHTAEAIKDDCWEPHAAQQAFEGLVIAGKTVCTKCSVDVRLIDYGNIDLDEDQPPQLSKCIRLICGSCLRKLDDLNQSVATWCGHDTQCLTTSVSTAINDEGISDGSRGSELEQSPAKIRALVKDIQNFRGSKM
jgi:SWI/SNF-related matrix-associated actin-dependent regulator of chromatin subfamily A3